MMKRQDARGYKPVEVANIDHFPHVKGYEFNEGFDFSRFAESFSTTGLQASHLAQAADVWRKAESAHSTIFLSYTSNMVSSGVREVIRYLVQHKKVHVLVTSAGGIEEDLIKCIKPFLVGSFDAPGRVLHSKGINRIGNIFVPNDRYLHFERFFNGVMEKVHKRAQGEGKIVGASQMCRELGLAIDDESSILYWAAKNDIPVFCPAITDGSIGDLIMFFRQRHKEFYLDVAQDMQEVSRIALNANSTAVICLGAGTPKHFVLNANIFRDGADFAVYINTAQEFDGSDSGARVDEAVTWAKVKPDAPNVKVHADASIAFPLLVAMVFFSQRKKKQKKRAGKMRA